MLYQLPVTNSPNQTFTTTIQIDGNNVRLKFFLNWNICTNTWEVTLIRGTEEIVTHAPLIVGNVLPHKAYLGLGTLYVNGNGEKPDLENLGVDYQLYWVTEDE